MSAYIEEGNFATDTKNILARLMSWGVCRRAPYDTLDSIVKMLSLFHYTVIKHDEVDFGPSRNDFPEWNHIGNSHHAQGKKYWDLFWNREDKAIAAGKPSIRIGLAFGDQPDFWGHIDDVKFVGDIGTVGGNTFANELRLFQKENLWISFIDNREYIFEALLSPQKMYSDYLSFITKDSTKIFSIAEWVDSEMKEPEVCILRS